MELALQSYENHEAYKRRHPDGLKVKVVDKKTISRINAIPVHGDDPVVSVNTAGVSPAQKERIACLKQAIKQQTQQKYRDDWLEAQEPHPLFPERIIVKDEYGDNRGSIPKSRVSILPEEEARPVVGHSQGLPRNSTDHTEGCVIGLVDKYFDGEQEVYLVLDMKSYEHMEALLKAERSREITQAFRDGKFTYDDFLRLTTG